MHRLHKLVPSGISQVAKWRAGFYEDWMTGDYSGVCCSNYSFTAFRRAKFLNQRIYFCWSFSCLFYVTVPPFSFLNDEKRKGREEFKFL